MQNDLEALVSLHLTIGLGGHTIRQLVSFAGSAEDVYKLPKGRLELVHGIGKGKAEVILKNKQIDRARSILQKAAAQNIKVVSYLDEAYPSRLKQCYDAPSILFYKGNADINSRKIIAIVGTRKATEYGKGETERIVSGLTPWNPVIVSGLAYGIDMTAHATALSCGLKTIGVMAHGHDHMYPSSHYHASQQMLVNGGLLTEYEPSEIPEPGKFPARNRIIAGLCDAIIVVEAAAKGGALITADMGNSYGREVFAVPGHLTSRQSEGCNLLIRNHKAHILTKPEDIPYILGWDMKPEQRKLQMEELPPLSGEEKSVYELVSKLKECFIEDISYQTGIPLNKLATHLLSLEFNGLIKSLPGNRFRIAA